MAIGDFQRAPRHLVDTHEQFGRVGPAEHFLDEAVDVRVAMVVDVSQAEFLFVEAFANRARHIRVIKDVAARFELHFEFGNGQRPRALGLHETSFPIKETEQTPAIFLDRELAAKPAKIARKAIRIRAGAFGGGHAFGGTRVG